MPLMASSPNCGVEMESDEEGDHAPQHHNTDTGVEKCGNGGCLPPSSCGSTVSVVAMEMDDEHIPTPDVSDPHSSRLTVRAHSHTQDDGQITAPASPVDAKGHVLWDEDEWELVRRRCGIRRQGALLLTLSP